MALATKVLALAAPDLTPPTLGAPGGRGASVRRGAGRAAIAAAVVEQALIERRAVDPGSVAVIVPDSLVGAVAAAFEEQGIEFGRAARNGLNSQITIVPVSLVKGLELDASVVVEPAAILEEEVQGARSLYVALTRATKRLALVHERRCRRPDVAPRPRAAAAAARGGCESGPSTRMQDAWLAKAPMPTWRPLTSTVVVPSGEAAVIVPVLPGHDVGVLEELEQAGGELELLGDPGDGEAAADGRRRTAAPRRARGSRRRGSGCRGGRWWGCRAPGRWPPRPARR